MKKLIKISATAVPLFLLIFACLACQKEKIMDTRSISTLNDTAYPAGATGLKYLALGDSYTIGQSVQETDRFPAQTAKILAGENIGVASIKYIATTGWTTTNLLNAISFQNLSPNFDFVTLLIGVNDQYQHKDTASYRTNFTALLNTSISLAGSRPSRVFVLSIPDYSVTPFVAESNKARVSGEIDVFNNINREVTLAYNIAYIDITPASREAAKDPTLIATDGLHPSGKQYAKWASLLGPVIKKRLK